VQRARDTGILACMSQPLLRARDLHKRYGAKHALVGVSIEVSPGEVVGFLGANGAGKTTTLRILAGTLEADAGRVEIDGIDAARAPLAARERIGYLPEHDGLFEGMRVDELLRFHGASRGLRGAALATRVDELVARLHLRAVLGSRVQACSLGYRRRVALAATLVGDPAVLLFDEPTHGLDPLQIRAFRALLRDVSPGRAIVFSTHVLQEVEHSCSRVVLVDEGRIVLDAPLAALQAQAAAAGGSLEDFVVERTLARKDA
jgi:ABC-2 type transport system ATP-binding protein